MPEASDDQVHEETMANAAERHMREIIPVADVQLQRGVQNFGYGENRYGVFQWRGCLVVGSNVHEKRTADEVECNGGKVVEMRRSQQLDVPMAVAARANCQRAIAVIGKPAFVLLAVNHLLKKIKK